MAKCNLLRPLNTQGGTFFTFSQWGEDLTLQNALGDAYRIVPSRFACMNINYSGKTNDQVGSLFQDKFEHRCAAFRHYFDNDTNEVERFTPRHASILFWDTLKNHFNVTIGRSNSNSEIVYVGEMDLQGTNYIDGVSYSELYCIVPTNAKRMSNWEVASSPSQPTADITFSNACLEANYPFRWTSASYPTSSSSVSTHQADSTISIPTFYDGPAILTCEDNQTRYSSLNTLDSLHQVFMQDILNNRNYFELKDDTQFTFNTIALFYDIVAKDEHNDYHYIYTAVPMGIYFTGQIDGNTLENEVNKVVTNDDIYGQGSSYGLRVTTKFCAESLLPQGGQNTSGAEVTASLGDLYPEMAAVMDRFNAAAESLDDYTDQVQSYIEQMNIHLSDFKDNRVNVPYIREVRESADAAPVKYWFVNGRSTGVRVEGTNNIIIEGSGSGQDLNQLIENIVQNVINDNTTIPNIINNYITNNNPGGAIEAGSWIEHIPHDKYKGTSITQVPNIQDYQDLSGNEAAGMFKDCTNLVRIPRLELANSTSMDSSFMNCRSLESICIPDTISVKSFSNAFKGCSSLKRLVLDATSVEQNGFTNAFDGCSALTDLRIDNIDPIKVDDIDLSGTNIDFASLEYLVMHMKTQEYNPSFDTVGPVNSTVNLHLPSSLTTNSRSVMDLIYNAQMNKGILIKIV